ncbi:CD209 antigen-like protein C [Rattus norvegicus]|uniref:CD209 antigen-like protein C n=1 Tax=Rattus norvegicus TaxID=10116 RepID=UPI001916FA5F|nr:CD209 antigen-like protein C [Rattus norvegicus]
MVMCQLLSCSEVPTSQEHDHEKQRIHQKLDQLKAKLDHLCRPCSWDWMFFQGNCYFFSTFQEKWKESVKACKDMGAQLVVIKSNDEQSFLQRTCKKKRNTWMGLSDRKEEGQWLWVDGSPLLFNFRNYWSAGEPNNQDNEDCAVFSDSGWNDITCSHEAFWVCKKPASPCSK